MSSCNNWFTEFLFLLLSMLFSSCENRFSPRETQFSTVLITQYRPFLVWKYFPVLRDQYWAFYQKSRKRGYSRFTGTVTTLHGLPRSGGFMVGDNNKFRRLWEDNNFHEINGFLSLQLWLGFELGLRLRLTNKIGQEILDSDPLVSVPLDSGNG